MQILKLVWDKFQKFGLFIGNIISTIVLTVFYFTIFALFATPFRLFSNIFAPKQKDSNWVVRPKNIADLKDLETE
jgi:hypothetical protein